MTPEEKDQAMNHFGIKINELTLLEAKDLEPREAFFVLLCEACQIAIIHTSDTKKKFNKMIHSHLDEAVKIAYEIIENLTKGTENE